MMNRNAIALHCIAGNVFLVDGRGAPTTPWQARSVANIFQRIRFMFFLPSFLRMWCTGNVPLRLPYTLASSLSYFSTFCGFCIHSETAHYSNSGSSTATAPSTRPLDNITTRHHATEGLLALRIFFSFLIKLPNRKLHHNNIIRNIHTLTYPSLTPPSSQNFIFSRIQR